MESETFRRSDPPVFHPCFCEGAISKREIPKNSPRNVRVPIFSRTIESRRNNTKRSLPEYLDEKNMNGSESIACVQEAKNVKRHHDSVPFRCNQPNVCGHSDCENCHYSSVQKKKYANNESFPLKWRAYPLERLNLRYSFPLHFPRLPPDKFMMRAQTMRVKETPKTLLIGSKWDKLSQEIWNTFFLSQQSEEVYLQKINLWKYLYISIKGIFPKYSLYLVGSTLSGFGVENSDMDLCLLVKSFALDLRFQAIYHLNNVQQFIKSTDIFGDIELIKAKVPILKFKDHYNSIEVDLNCNNPVGIHNTHLLYCYSQLDWRVRPLVLMVKLWAKHNNINDPKNRTISSYSLVLMVIHYLQCAVSPPVLPCLQQEMPEKFNGSTNIYQIDLCERMPEYLSKNTQTLGELLCGFFKYYISFEYEKSVISVRTGKLLNINDVKIAKGSFYEAHEWKFLCIEEPFDLSNTARSVYDADVFKHILETFRKTSITLENCLSIKSVIPDIGKR